MHKPFFLFAICLLFAMQLKASFSYPCSRIDPELEENASYIIRDRVVEFSVNSLQDTRYEIKEAKTFLDRNEYAQTLYIHYSTNRIISNIKVELFDCNGKSIRKINKKEFKDYSAIDGWIEDDRVIKIDLSYNSYPYTAVYSYDVVNSSSAFYPSLILHNPEYAIEKSTLILHTPSNISFRQKAINFDIAPTTKSKGDIKTFIWEVNNVKALELEENMPSYWETCPQLYLAPNDFIYYGNKGSMETWKDYGKFYYELNKDRNQLAPVTVQEIKRLTKDCTSDREKVAVLYKEMQDKFRYISVQLGVGGWQTFEASYVEKNEFGDCKALTNYMMSMLEVIDIKSNAVLVDAGQNFREVSEDFTIPHFNHVICYVPSEDMWLECTSKNNPSNFLGDFTADRPALLVDKENSKLIRTPKYSDNKEIREFDVQIEETGAATIDGFIEYREMAQKGIRGMNSFYTQEQMETYIQNLFDLNGMQIEEYNVVVDEDSPTSKIELKMHVRKFGNVSGNRIFIPALDLCQNSISFPKATEREHPLEFKNQTHFVDKIKISIPENYKIESAPKGNSEVKDELIDYQLVIEVKDSELNLTRNCKMNDVSLGKEAYSDLLSSIKKVEKLNKSKIVLAKNNQ